MSTKPTKRRVKVYKMANGSWEDQGTGYIECIKLEKFDAPALVVKSEDNDTTILESKIDPRPDTYMKQQDTLIVWNEPVDNDDDSLDLALSFQEAAGCSEIWDELAEIQRVIGPPQDKVSDELEIPAANLNNIDQLVSLFEFAQSTSRERDTMARLVLKQQYLPKLFALFEVIDDLDNEENLEKMFFIVRALFLFNNRALIEELLTDQFCYHVMKALENDPNIPPAARIHHAEFLKTTVVFKEVVPFKEPQVLKKIHQTFRLTYLKDIALPRTMDEAVILTISAMIHLNNLQIISYLTSDAEWLDTLVNVIQAEQDLNNLGEQLAFVNELCEMSQVLEEGPRLSFIQILLSDGMMHVLEKSICCDNLKVRTSCARIIVEITATNATLLRTYILGQQDNQLLKCFVVRLSEEEDTGMKILLLDIIRNVLDDQNPDELMSVISKPAIDIKKGNEDIERLLDIFYRDFAYQLFEPILQDFPSTAHSEASLLLKSSLCDLLGTFVEHHAARAKTFILKNAVIGKVFFLLKAKEKYLAACAIRFFRKVVGMNDPAYDQHIIEQNLFLPIIQIFISNGDRYNLLNSVILEVFEHIADPKQSHQSLVKYYVENFHQQFELDKITYPNPFTTLQATYERLKNYPEEDDSLGKTQELPDPVREKKRRKWVEELLEEAWFEEDDGADGEDEDEEDEGSKKRNRENDDDQDNDQSPRKKLRQ